MKNINYDVKIEIKELSKNIVTFMKNFMFYVSEEFVSSSKNRAHNIENHVIDFKKKNWNK